MRTVKNLIRLGGKSVFAGRTIILLVLTWSGSFNAVFGVCDVLSRMCISIYLCFTIVMSRLRTKPTKWLCAQQRLRSAWASADAQADLSLRWAHTHFVCFVMSWLISEYTDQKLQWSKAFLTSLTLGSLSKCNGIWMTVEILRVRLEMPECLCNDMSIK